ncbi:MAG: nucleotide exchange factor GrpE [Mycoplasmataceae bacterium]|jgi:molecular chaperone GrpE|nr:nucleotide exchange factor GrpE [Mycoplasmataceae bacterium]
MKKNILLWNIYKVNDNLALVIEDNELLHGNAVICNIANEKKDDTVALKINEEDFFVIPYSFSTIDKKLLEQQESLNSELYSLNDNIKTEILSKYENIAQNIFSDKNSKLAEKNSLNKQLVEKNNRLEEQLKSINNDYVNKLSAKMAEAAEMLKKKQAELTEKSNTEILEAKKYAIAKPATEFITVINQFETALSFEPKDDKLKNYQNGFKMFLNMFKNVLSDVGIEEISVNVGDEYNTITMEAIDHIDAEGVKSGNVAAIISKGYKLHDRVLQTVTVKLAN